MVEVELRIQRHYNHDQVNDLIHNRRVTLDYSFHFQHEFDPCLWSLKEDYRFDVTFGRDEDDRLMIVEQVNNRVDPKEDENYLVLEKINTLVHTID